MTGPEPTERIQPGIQFLKWFWLQSVEAALSVHCGFDETGLAQDPEVLGHGRLRHPKATLDLSNRPLGRDQEAQNRAAVRLRDDFEDGFHGLSIPPTVYTCQGIYETRRPEGHRRVVAAVQSRSPRQDHLANFLTTKALCDPAQVARRAECHRSPLCPSSLRVFVQEKLTTEDADNAEARGIGLVQFKHEDTKGTEGSPLP